MIDPAFFDDAGPVRQGWLAATLKALDEAYDGHLCLRHGDPATVIPALAREVGATQVHVSTETEPGGAARDGRVRAALADHGVEWVETGSPYAVTPGRVLNRTGQPYRVFTPFSRAWQDHGWRPPAAEPAGLQLATAPSHAGAWHLVDAALDGVPDRPAAGR